MKKFIIFLILTFSFTSLFINSANAASYQYGEVITHPYSCDYYVVEYPSGYAVLEWYGGNDPDEGDIIYGKFNSYGFKNLYNLTMKRKTRAYVEDYWLSQDKANSLLIEKCY